MNNQLIINANNNLTALFGAKHKLITVDDINAVYKRDVLSINADAKTVKGYDKGYLTGILYLAPSTISGFNLCKAASAGCKAACLFSAGRGKFYSVYRSRVIKTLAFLNDQDKFMRTIIKSIEKLIAKANKLNLNPVVRLNGTSDIDWTKINLKDDLEFINIFDYYKTYSGYQVQFYDYTKHPDRIVNNKQPNYHLTFSRSEVNYRQADYLLSLGYNAAVVFKGDLPDYYNGYKVINGDLSDLRFLDPQGVIVGLKAKGQAKKDKSGFVIDVNNQCLPKADNQFKLI